MKKITIFVQKTTILLQNTAFFASDVSDEFKAIDESVEDLA